MKIIKSRDKKLVEEIDKKLEENKQKYGERYCPCALVRDKEHICMCKDFVENIQNGPCHCGKYIKIED